MPVAIQPGRSDARGFVTSQRPGPTTLDALASALDAGTDLAKTEYDKFQKKQLDEATDLLSSPLITEEEIAELEARTNSPLIHQRARNARGGLIVEERIAAIEDEASKAPDALTARTKLREAQQALIESEQDPAVRAGIRQRMAEHSTRILSQAAVRRVDTVKREHKMTVASDLQAGLENGATAYGEIFSGHLYDATIAGEDMYEFNQDAVGTLRNYWQSGDDGLDDNPDTPRVLEAIDIALQNPGLIDHKERSLWTQFREEVETDKERRKGNPEAALLKVEEANHLAMMKAADNWIAKNPGKPFPPEWAQQLRDAAPSRAALNAVRSLVDTQLADERLPGVLGTREYQEAHSMLAPRQRDANGVIDETAVAATELFEAGARALPPALKEPGREIELRQALTEMSKQSLAQATRNVDTVATVEAAFNEKIIALDNDLVAAQQLGDPEAIAKANGAIAFEYEQHRTGIRNKFASDLNRMIYGLGYTPNYVDTLP